MDRRIKQNSEKQPDFEGDDYREVTISEDSFMTEEDWSDLRMINHQNGQNKSFQKKPVGSYEAKPPDKKLPCFTQAYYGNCEAKDKCIYSHDPAVLQGYLNTELKKIKASPQFKDQSSYSGPRQHILESTNLDSEVESEDDTNFK